MAHRRVLFSVAASGEMDEQVYLAYECPEKRQPLAGRDNCHSRDYCVGGLAANRHPGLETCQ
jgi:hypothetical protein